MPKDIEFIPDKGPGSRSPQQMEPMHTPKGGVPDVKPQGLPGRPLGALEGSGAGGGLLGGEPSVQDPDESLKVIIESRAEKRLATDLQDIYIDFYNDIDEERPGYPNKIKYDFTELDFSYLIDRLINHKGWALNNIKELIPSREEKVIVEYFNKLANSNTSVNSDVNQETNSLLNIGSNAMSKQSDLILENGTIKKAEASLAQPLLDQMTAAIFQVRQARKQAKRSFLTKMGSDALKEMGAEMADVDPAKGADEEMFGAAVDVEGFTDSVPADADLKTVISDLKEGLEKLTSLVEEYGLTSDSLGTDDMLKGDQLLDKAEKEIDGAEADLETMDKLESKPKKEKKEEKDKKEEKEDKDEGAVKEAALNDYQPDGAKKIEVKKFLSNALNPAQDKKALSEGQGGDPMEAAVGKKATMDELKAKLAKLKELRNNVADKKEAQLYGPDGFTDVANTGALVSPTNEETAAAQISEINSDMAGGFDKDADASISPKDIATSVEKPGMAVTKEYNKAASENNAFARKAAVQAVSKARIAMELAGTQQLKGLLANPLKEELISKFAEIGVDKNISSAIIHNAFIDKFEDSQRVVIAEAFDVLANKDDSEFVKIASFTMDFSEDDVDDETVGEDDNSIISKESKKSGDGVMSKTASLRGSQVNSDNSQQYTHFWRAAYEEGR